MGNRQPPVQQAPPAQKLRLRYAKRGPARFTSHRDFGRALERALRRAEIPMAYSSGFSPHPRISYANAAPTSAASEAEYVELGLKEVCAPAKVVEALNEVLPHGFVVLGDSADFLYKTTDYYAPEHERCIAWDDPAVGIAWPLAAHGIRAPLLSAKDRAGVALAQAELPD